VTWSRKERRAPIRATRPGGPRCRGIERKCEADHGGFHETGNLGDQGFEVAVAADEFGGGDAVRQIVRRPVRVVPEEGGITAALA
jgi:hypothetical protein